MNTRELATHYLAFWSAPGQLSDNAPPVLRDFLNSLPKTTERFAAYTSLAHLAANANAVLAPQSVAYMAGWIAARPHTYLLCDEILLSKKPPKSFGELMERTFRTAQQDVTDLTRAWLKQQLALT